jgi:putative nucleotidyltransferase with HDIG domain
MEPFNLASLLPPDLDRQKEILKEYVESMPTFSPATAKIIQLTSRLDTPAAEIVAAIRLDPILTGKVLQLVNSAYFSLAQKITSLNRAVVYLGINTIKNVALSTAVMQTFEAKSKDLANQIRPTWYHSLATAVCAKGIARAAGVDAKILEEYFIAGLLHDLGKIILIQAFHSTTPHNGHLTLEEENKKYGIDHCRVGAAILTRWKFPDELIQSIATYYAPPAHCKLANFLHVADAMTYRLDLNGESNEAYTHAILPESYGVIGISEEKILSELASAPEHIQKAEVFLNIAGNTETVEEE